MKKLVITLIFLTFGWGSSASAERVLSIGGAVTEYIYALGEEDRLVGRDSTSMYPRAVMELPNVGYIRGLSPEGVMSVEPELVLARTNNGPAEAVEVLKSSGLNWVDVPADFTEDGIMLNVDIIATALGVQDKGEVLKAKLAAELDATAAIVETINDPQSAIFILSTRGGGIMASGMGSGADGIMRLSGVENVFTDYFGYKTVTDEAIIEAAPDVMILMESRDGDHGAQDDFLLAHPALSLTPAGQTGRIIRIDGSKMLTFGPRTAEAALELAQMVYGDLN